MEILKQHWVMLAKRGTHPKLTALAPLLMTISIYLIECMQVELVPAWSLHPHDVVSLGQKVLYQKRNLDTNPAAKTYDLQHLLPWKVSSGHGGAELVVLTNQPQVGTGNLYRTLPQQLRITDCFPAFISSESVLPLLQFLALLCCPGVVLGPLFQVLQLMRGRNSYPSLMTSGQLSHLSQALIHL